MPDQITLTAMVEAINTRGQDLTPWEIDFIRQQMDYPPKTWTPALEAKVRQIYGERVT
jgi:hypothetical protein